MATVSTIPGNGNVMSLLYRSSSWSIQLTGDVTADTFVAELVASSTITLGTSATYDATYDTTTVVITLSAPQALTLSLGTYTWSITQTTSGNTRTVAQGEWAVVSGNVVFNPPLVGYPSGPFNFNSIYWNGGTNSTGASTGQSGTNYIPYVDNAGLEIIGSVTIDGANDVVTTSQVTSNGDLELFGNAGTGITVDATTGGATMPSNTVTDARKLMTNIWGTVEKVVLVSSIADNVATPIFTITTNNETGSSDGGAYVCIIDAIVGHQLSSTTLTAQAAKAWRGQFTRVMEGGGTGVNTAVENIFSGASAATAPATRDIGTITVTVTETSEYVQTVNFQIDLTGASVTTARVLARVTVIANQFVTMPVIA